MSLDSINYCCFADYSPRGTSEIALRSKGLCGSVKAARLQILESALPFFEKENANVLKSYLNEDAVLVPIPRSAPLTEGATWPSKTIAEMLAANNLGKEVYPCIERVKAIRKSSSNFGTDTRPTVYEHLDTLRVNKELLQPKKIVLVDDVLTAGRTAFACALKLKEAFPDAEISLFTMIRTQSFDELEKIINPVEGTIIYYPDSGKTWRE